MNDWNLPIVMHWNQTPPRPRATKRPQQPPGNAAHNSILARLAEPFTSQHIQSILSVTAPSDGAAACSHKVIATWIGKGWIEKVGHGAAAGYRRKAKYYADNKK